MSLQTNLPEEVQERLAEFLHENVCESHDDEMDDDEADECLEYDVKTVRDMLRLLDEAGVTYTPSFFPNERNSHATETS